MTFEQLKAKVDADNSYEGFHEDFKAVGHAKGLPLTVILKVYSLAWDMGHASGLNDVLYYAEDLFELAETAYSAGKENAKNSLRQALKDLSGEG